MVIILYLIKSNPILYHLIIINIMFILLIHNYNNHPH